MKQAVISTEKRIAHDIEGINPVSIVEKQNLIFKQNNLISRKL